MYVKGDTESVVHCYRSALPILGFVVLLDMMSWILGRIIGRIPVLAWISHLVLKSLDKLVEDDGNYRTRSRSNP